MTLHFSLDLAFLSRNEKHCLHACTWDGYCLNQLVALLCCSPPPRLHLSELEAVRQDSPCLSMSGQCTLQPWACCLEIGVFLGCCTSSPSSHPLFFPWRTLNSLSPLKMLLRIHFLSATNTSNLLMLSTLVKTVLNCEVLWFDQSCWLIWNCDQQCSSFILSYHDIKNWLKFLTYWRWCQKQQYHHSSRTFTQSMSVTEKLFEWILALAHSLYERKSAYEKVGLTLIGSICEGFHRANDP